MHAKIPKGRSPFDKPADGVAAIPPAAGPVPSASKLSAAFGAALGEKAPPGHIPPIGKGGLKPGHSRPDQINKAPKPAAGAKKPSSPGHGHR